MSFGGSWIAGFRLSKVLESGCWGSRQIGVQVRLENAASQRLKDDTSPRNGCCTATWWLLAVNLLKRERLGEKSLRVDCCPATAG